MVSSSLALLLIHPSLLIFFSYICGSRAAAPVGNGEKFHLPIFLLILLFVCLKNAGLAIFVPTLASPQTLALRLLLLPLSPLGELDQRGLRASEKGRTDGRTDGRTEFLPILQNVVPYRGPCPKKGVSVNPSLFLK